MGQALIARLAEIGGAEILALDLRALPPDVAARCAVVRTGDVLDAHLLARLMSEFELKSEVGKGTHVSVTRWT